MKKLFSLITILFLITSNLFAANIPIDYMEYATDGAMQTNWVTNASAGAYSNTGGTITTDGDYKVHTFKIGDTGTSFVAYKAGNVEYLVVAGGGGGGGDTAGGDAFAGGGGGAGGYKTGTLAVTAQSYTITVGDGGTGGNGGSGTNGSNSVFSSITSTGGGGGGGNYPTSGAGLDGGSGGGAQGVGADGGSASPSGQGNNGGSGSASATYYAAGGGGGAGAVGGNGNSSSAAGNGGVGLQNDISGTNIYYAGGGGGAIDSTGTLGTGGNGGGGNGSKTAANPGTDDLGGGGGGRTDGAAGDGGSGVVVIRCLTADFSADPVLQSYSEATIKTQGSYALKGIAAITDSATKTLTRTVSPTINLSDQTLIKFDGRTSRTGSNIKIGFHDSGGTTTETTPNQASADTFQNNTVDISAVSNANKDAIDSVIITITNADAANTFYFDNMFDSVCNDIFGVIE